MNVMMLCGHAANATDENGQPACVICMPNPTASQIDDTYQVPPGRMAMCHYCKRLVPSSTDLAFFAAMPGATDDFYCGCRGWG